MSSIVCQGLQSCLEPRLVEPWALRLKLASPRPHFSRSVVCARSFGVPDSNTEEHHDQEKYQNMMSSDESKTDCNTNSNISNGDLGEWSFIQALTNISQTPREAKEKESLYVHPLFKHSSSTLSEKSLDLCTENLGCETGTDISENSGFSSSTSDSESGKPPTRKIRQLLGNGKVNCRNFPPPLTSISGSGRVHVRSHREGGRLVVKAVTVPSSHTYFEAERGDGRLRLRFLKNYSPESQEEEEEEEESDVYLGEEMDGNNGNIGGEMTIGEFERPSRCKEGGCGNKGLLDWEPLWVSTTS
ncbi:hypothetical protein HHK36_026706 [Tetracentron sinense]|uniref:FAF domain-containing protein n=1 Tax=Tetracentron sinense TaxID=13715 RepID=A0A834YHB0_TETSI|nr:hypothetical protein HHK36_026706 [Tetracentron sinense]